MNVKKISNSEFKSADTALDAAPTELLIADVSEKFIQFYQKKQTGKVRALYKELSQVSSPLLEVRAGGASLLSSYVYC